MSYQAIFVHEGKTIDYTPAADVALGEVVVQGERAGVVVAGDAEWRDVEYINSLARTVKAVSSPS